MSIEDM